MPLQPRRPDCDSHRSSRVDMSTFFRWEAAFVPRDQHVPPRLLARAIPWLCLDCDAGGFRLVDTSLPLEFWDLLAGRTAAPDGVPAPRSAEREDAGATVGRRGAFDQYPHPAA